MIDMSEAIEVERRVRERRRRKYEDAIVGGLVWFGKGERKNRVEKSSGVGNIKVKWRGNFGIVFWWV